MPHVFGYAPSDRFMIAKAGSVSHLVKKTPWLREGNADVACLCAAGAACRLGAAVRRSCLGRHHAQGGGSPGRIGPWGSRGTLQGLAARPRSGGAAGRWIRSGRRFRVQAEDSCQAQGIGAGGHGFFELAVDAQGLDGRGVAAQGGVNPGSADRPGIQGGLGVDERVRVGGSWPSGAALLEPKSET